MRPGTERHNNRWPRFNDWTVVIPPDEDGPGVWLGVDRGRRVLTWTKNRDEALWFAREVDAKALLRTCGGHRARIARVVPGTAGESGRPTLADLMQRGREDE